MENSSREAESLWGTEAVQVKDYAKRVDDSIQALDKEIEDGLDEKYGAPVGSHSGHKVAIPAGPNAAELASERSVDWKLFSDWLAFKNRWAAKKKEVDGQFYGSDKRYAEVKAFEDEAKTWVDKWSDRGLKVSGGGRLSAPFDWGLLLTTVGLIGAAGFGSYYIFKNTRETALAELSDEQRYLLSFAKQLPPRR